MIGEVFGRLTISGVSAPEVSTSGKKKRKVLVTCDCGSVFSVRKDSLVSGNTQSCGCLQKEKATNTLKTHGESKSRLYRCWESMHYRAKGRKDCVVYKGWDDFKAFSKWARRSGYTDKLVLCRNNDVGDYTPDNCRWDTRLRNNQEAHSKKYEVTNISTGVSHSIKNLSKFCRENSLTLSSVYKVINGKRRKHKGFSFKKI